MAFPATITDAEGRFTIDRIDPGSYLLIVQRVGYLDQGYGASAPQIVGPPLTLGPGETKRDLTIRLTPQSLLYGKVVDEDNDPAPGAQVQVLRVSYAGGARRLVEAAAGVSQDDGSFVIGNLSPGRYYLSAAIPNIDAPRGHERHIPTYLPERRRRSHRGPNRSRRRRRSPRSRHPPPQVPRILDPGPRRARRARDPPARRALHLHRRRRPLRIRRRPSRHAPDPHQQLRCRLHAAPRGRAPRRQHDGRSHRRRRGGRRRPSRQGRADLRAR